MNIIIEPLVTEKSISLSESGKYVFVVQKKATKNEIKKAVEKTFKVKVTDVNIINRKEKVKRRGRIMGKSPGFKKAIITLAKGQKIKELEVKG